MLRKLTHNTEEGIASLKAQGGEVFAAIKNRTRTRSRILDAEAPEVSVRGRSTTTKQEKASKKPETTDIQGAVEQLAKESWDKTVYTGLDRRAKRMFALNTSYPPSTNQLEAEYPNIRRFDFHKFITKLVECCPGNAHGLELLKASHQISYKIAADDILAQIAARLELMAELILLALQPMYQVCKCRDRPQGFSAQHNQRSADHLARIDRAKAANCLDFPDLQTPPQSNMDCILALVRAFLHVQGPTVFLALLLHLCHSSLPASLEGQEWALKIIWNVEKIKRTDFLSKCSFVLVRTSAVTMAQRLAAMTKKADWWEEAAMSKVCDQLSQKAISSHAISVVFEMLIGEVITPVQKAIQSAKGYRPYSKIKPFAESGILEALAKAVSHAPFEATHDALSYWNVLVLKLNDNALCMLRQPDCFRWFTTLVLTGGADTECNQKRKLQDKQEAEVLISNVMKLSINIIVVLLHAHFMHYDGSSLISDDEKYAEQVLSMPFSKILIALIDALEDVALWTTSTVALIRVMLESLVVKVGFSLPIFRQDPSSFAWESLFDFCGVLEDFLFYSGVEPNPIRPQEERHFQNIGIHLSSNGSCVDTTLVRLVLALFQQLKLVDLENNMDAFPSNLKQRLRKLLTRAEEESEFFGLAFHYFECLNNVNTPAEVRDKALRTVSDVLEKRKSLYRSGKTGGIFRRLTKGKGKKELNKRLKVATDTQRAMAVAASLNQSKTRIRKPAGVVSGTFNPEQILDQAQRQFESQEQAEAFWKQKILEYRQKVHDTNQSKKPRNGPRTVGRGRKSTDKGQIARALSQQISGHMAVALHQPEGAEPAGTEAEKVPEPTSAGADDVEPSVFDGGDDDEYRESVVPQSPIDGEPASPKPDDNADDIPPPPDSPHQDEASNGSENPVAAAGSTVSAPASAPLTVQTGAPDATPASGTFGTAGPSTLHPPKASPKHPPKAKPVLRPSSARPQSIARLDFNELLYGGAEKTAVSVDLREVMNTDTIVPKVIEDEESPPSPKSPNRRPPTKPSVDIRPNRSSRARSQNVNVEFALENGLQDEDEPPARPQNPGVSDIPRVKMSADARPNHRRLARAGRLTKIKADDEDSPLEIVQDQTNFPVNHPGAFPNRKPRYSLQHTKPPEIVPLQHVVKLEQLHDDFMSPTNARNSGSPKIKLTLDGERGSRGSAELFTLGPVPAQAFANGVDNNPFAPTNSADPSGGLGVADANVSAPDPSASAGASASVSANASASLDAAPVISANASASLDAVPVSSPPTPLPPGTASPSTALSTPGTIPLGTVPPGAVPPGAASPRSTIPPGAAPPGAAPPGASDLDTAGIVAALNAVGPNDTTSILAAINAIASPANTVTATKDPQSHQKQPSLAGVEITSDPGAFSPRGVRAPSRAAPRAPAASVTALSASLAASGGTGTSSPPGLNTLTSAPASTSSPGVRFEDPASPRVPVTSSAPASSAPARGRASGTSSGVNGLARSNSQVIDDDEEDEGDGFEDEGEEEDEEDEEVPAEIRPSAIDAMAVVEEEDNFELKCVHCKLKFDQYFEHDGLPYCKEDYTRLFMVCGSCKQLVEKNQAYVSVSAKDGEGEDDGPDTQLWFHANHFGCLQCQKPFVADLPGGGFRVYGGAAYCLDDYNARWGVRCHHCNEFVDGSSTRALGLEFHPGHFLCDGGCGRAFDGNTNYVQPIQADWLRITQVGKFTNPKKKPRKELAFCEDCYSDICGLNCSVCQLTIKATEPRLTLQGHTFHTHCFKCSVCTQPKEGEKLSVRDDKLYCANHFAMQFMEKCTTCALPLDTSGVSINGVKYHENCVVCHVCHTPLPPDGLYVSPGGLACRNHCQATTSQCFMCGDFINEDALVLSGKTMHKTCLKCCRCATILSEGGLFTSPLKTEPSPNDYLFCRDHYHLEFSEKCQSCNLALTGSVVLISGSKYHPHCAKCSKCQTSLVVDGKLKGGSDPQTKELFCLTHATPAMAARRSTIGRPVGISAPPVAVPSRPSVNSPPPPSRPAPHRNSVNAGPFATGTVTTTVTTGGPFAASSSTGRPTLDRPESSAPPKLDRVDSTNPDFTASKSDRSGSVSPQVPHRAPPPAPGGSPGSVPAPGHEAPKRPPPAKPKA